MAIHRSRDSLSNCNDLYEYNDKLQVTRRSDLKVAPTYSKDTISPSHSLTREALARLESPSKGIIMQQSVIFRSIGKYVFLSVALPPYFLLYGLPKWLLVEGFAWLTFTLGWLTKQVKETLKKPFDIFIQKINQIVFFVQMVAKRILQPVAKLGIQLRQFFQNLNAGAQQIIQPFMNGLKSNLKKPFSVLANFAGNIKNQAVNVRQRVIESLYTLHERIQDGLEWVKQTPGMLLGWGSAKLQMLQEKQFNWKEKVLAKFQLSSKAASISMDWLGKPCRLIKELIKTGIKPVEYFFRQGVQPVFKFISLKCQAGWSKMSGFLNDRKKRALEFLQSMQAKIKLWTPQHAFEKFLPTSFLAKLPELLRRILLAIKENPVTYAVFRAGFKAVIFLLMNSTKVMQTSIQGISNIFEGIASKTEKLKKRAGQSCKSLFNAVGGSFAFIKQGGAKGLHASLVFIFMIGILLGWGCQAVGQTTACWIEKISFRRRSSSS